MEEMYGLSQDIHMFCVIALIVILVAMLFTHKSKADFEVYVKKIQILMIVHISLIASLMLTGAIMMSAKHLTFTPANLLMIVSIFIISTLEIKRNKALAKVIKFKQMEPEVSKSIAFKYHLIELLLIIAVSGFAGMRRSCSIFLVRSQATAP